MKRIPPPGAAGHLDGLEALDRLLEFLRATNLWSHFWRTSPGTPRGFDHARTLTDLLNRYARVLQYRSQWLASNDPVRDLARVPVPADCAVPPRANQSLLQLLSAVTAKPHELISNKGDFNEGSGELVLLAAAWLNIGGDTASGYWTEEASKAYIVRLCSRAEQWLASNFPRMMFAPKVEWLIAASVSLPA